MSSHCNVFLWNLVDTKEFLFSCVICDQETSMIFRPKKFPWHVGEKDLILVKFKVVAQMKKWLKR